jgi:hypothetical protein
MRGMQIVERVRLRVLQQACYALYQDFTACEDLSRFGWVIGAFRESWFFTVRVLHAFQLHFDGQL